MEGLNGSVGVDSDFHTSGLMRYRSAPSSLLANFIDGEDFLPRSSNPETENALARLISCDSSCLTSESRDLQSMEAKSSPTKEEEMKNSHSFMSVMMENEAEVVQQSNEGFSAAAAAAASQLLYQQSQQNRGSHGSPASTVDGSPFRMSPLQQIDSQVKNNNNGPVSSLMRHSSSPAGFFSQLNIENGGYPMMRGTSRLKNEMRFSRQNSSTTGLMPQISEIGSESMGASSSDDGSLGNAGNVSRCYIPGFPVASWDDTPIENFTGMQLQSAELAASARKKVRDINGKMLSGFNSSESQCQNGETGNHAPPPGLAHHFSLPKTSAELATMEKLLQLQDSVPCKIRAKRGHATHPRSIAERVRRTRISERIKKLQEIVPNMDKQTNTSDMLDLAVEYIKDLQKQVKTLSDNRTSCTCSCKLKTYPSPAV